jgi:hypothetical protein
LAKKISQWGVNVGLNDEVWHNCGKLIHPIELPIEIGLYYADNHKTTVARFANIDIQLFMDKIQMPYTHTAETLDKVIWNVEDGFTLLKHHVDVKTQAEIEAQKKKRIAELQKQLDDLLSSDNQKQTEL